MAVLVIAAVDGQIEPYETIRSKNVFTSRVRLMGGQGSNECDATWALDSSVSRLSQRFDLAPDLANPEVRQVTTARTFALVSS